MLGGGGSKPFPRHPSPLLLPQAQRLSRHPRWGWLRSSPATRNVQRFWVASLSHSICRPARRARARARPKGAGPTAGFSTRWVWGPDHGTEPDARSRRAARPSAKETVRARARRVNPDRNALPDAATQDAAAATQRCAPVARPQPPRFPRDPRPCSLHRPGDPKSLRGDNGTAAYLTAPLRPTPPARPALGDPGKTPPPCACPQGPARLTPPRGACAVGPTPRVFSAWNSVGELTGVLKFDRWPNFLGGNNPKLAGSSWLVPKIGTL